MANLDIKSSFPPVSKSQWIQQIVTDLKGKPIESLKRTLPDGLEIQPFYTAEDIDKQFLNHSSLTRGRLAGWLNVPEIPFRSETETNAVLRDELTKGAEGLLLTIATENKTIDWKRLLNGLKLSDTPVWFRLDGQSEEVTKVLAQLLPYRLKGGLLDASITRFLQTSTVSANTLHQLAQATLQTSDSPNFRTLIVESHGFHNAGATAIQELAFTLNAVVDLYDYLSETGLSLEQLVPKTALSVSVGTSYFTEIAKLRAFRILWQRLITSYASSLRQSDSPLFLHAQTSTFYDATVTPDTNLLRATTEAMATVIGGCDALTVHPYDTVFAEPDEFSRRIARNVSILLKEEGHLDKTLDPAAGSYYLETLTAQLTESGWALFLEVERMGGLRKAFEQGFIQEEIEKAYRAKVEAVQNGRLLVGVTKFRTNDTATTANPKRQKTPTVLPDRRLAQAFE